MDKPSAQTAFSLKRTSDGAPVSGSFGWYGNALIFKPKTDLAGGAQYTASVSTAAKDRSRAPAAGGEDLALHNHDPPDHRLGLTRSMARPVSPGPR